MNVLIGTGLIGVAAVWIWLQLPNAQWRRAAVERSWDTAMFTAPRMLVALLGAGFFAELLPADQVRDWFGEGAGPAGLLLAVALGPVTPGGAFVSFAIGAAALKAGASGAVVVAYVCSWSLFSLTKILAYELSLMGREQTILRLLVSLPVPLAIAVMAAVIL